jgi:anaerobic magnesium-protoporphyrin IX monomethyl ester cyclase
MNCVSSKSGPRILLADPPQIKKNPYLKQFPNLGHLYLASALRKEFSDLEISYIDSRHSIQQHLHKVYEFRPDIYALSFSSPYANISKQIINLVKKQSPSTLVICGGAHPTVVPHEVLSNTSADLCCVGEGEITFVEIVRRYLSKQDIESVAGIAYRISPKKIRLSKIRPLVDDIDLLPFPAWNLVDFTKYTGCRKSRGEISTSIVASRGCPFHCVFCSNPVWRYQQPHFRKRSPESIAKEVITLYNMGIREIYIRSDEMNADEEWAIEVFQALSRLKKNDLFFQCNLRAAPVGPRLANAMADAQCWLCHIGIESASQRVLNGIKKGISLAEVEQSLQILKQFGIKTYGFFMCYQIWEKDDSLQIESSKEVLDTLKYVLRLKKRNLLDHASWSLATPYPGSELYDLCSKYGLFAQFPDEPPVVLSWNITMKLPGISRTTIAVMRFLGIMVQGLLFLCDSESYTLVSLKKNLKHAIYKLTFVAHLR